MMRRLLVTVIAISAVDSSAIDFDHYHTQLEISEYLRAVADEHPSFVSFHVLGSSPEGREIAFLKLVNNNDGKPRQAVYINGTHHGNEKSSTEAALGFVDFLISNADKNPARDLLERFAFYIQPLVNPDGHARGTRENSGGYDINRDYSFLDRSDEHSFSFVETRLVKSLVDQIPFVAAIAYHSGMEGVLWPNCFTSRRSESHSVFAAASKAAAVAMKMNYYAQSYFDYPSQGEFIDYAYMKQKTKAVTFEVSSAPIPSTLALPFIVARATSGTIAYLNSISSIEVPTLQFALKNPINLGSFGVH